MEIKNTINQYNEQRNRHCKTLEDTIKYIVEDTLYAIVNDLDDLMDDVVSGNYSLREIYEMIKKLKEKIN